MNSDGVLDWRMDTGIWPLFKVLMSTDTTASFWWVETCSPKDETAMFSNSVGQSCSLFASSCVIKDCWAPSSKRIWPSTVVKPAEMSAMTVFSKETLV